MFERTDAKINQLRSGLLPEDFGNYVVTVNEDDRTTLSLNDWHRQGTT